MYITQASTLLYYLYSGSNNNITVTDLDNKYSVEQITIAIKKTILYHHKSLLYPYSEETLEIKKSIDYNKIWNHAINLVKNGNSDLIAEDLQTCKLDISLGENFKIVINSTDNVNTIIMSINHIFCDGTSAFILLLLIKLYLKQNYIQFYFLSVFNKFDFLWQRKGLNLNISKDVKFINIPKLSNLEKNNLLVATEQITFDLDQNQIQKLKKMSFNKFIMAHSLYALSKSCNDTCDEVQLTKLIGLRGRVKGIGFMRSGEFHTAISYVFHRSRLNNFSQAFDLLNNTLKSDVIDCKAAIESDLNKYTNQYDVTEHMKKNKNTVPSISVSTFGFREDFSNDFENIKGYTPFSVGSQPKFIIFSGCINNKLLISFAYNPNHYRHERQTFLLLLQDSIKKYLSN